MAQTSAKDAATDIAAHAADMIDDAGEAARDIARRGRDAIRSAGQQAHDAAGQAVAEAGSAAQALYAQSGEVRAYMVRMVGAYPLSALLVAGAVGYGIACLSRRH